MEILKKVKETFSSIFPIMVIVTVLSLTVAPIEKGLLFSFLAGGVLLILGLTSFLTGVQMGVEPLGQKMGAVLTARRNLFLLLSVTFVTGFFVTVAEPVVQVFSAQVKDVYSKINFVAFISSISVGIGLFLVVGLLRTVLSLSTKWIMFFFYSLLFVLSIFLPNDFVSVVFDTGGATTGPMTVPFILAMGIGVASVRSSDHDEERDDQFGLSGITVIGPILAVSLYALFAKGKGALNVEDASFLDAGEYGIKVFFSLILPSIKDALMSIFSLAVLLVIFQLWLFKLPLRQFLKMVVGLLWGFIGLVIFFVGVNGGFFPAGIELGLILGKKAALSFFWKAFLVITALTLGAVVVCAEPSVWVLTEQVEELSGGTIRRRLMLIFMASGVAVAIAIAILRSIFGFPMLYILIAGYGIALILMLFCPNLFTSIAFDSGGSASGPIASTFILPFTMGVASSLGTGEDSFGVLALITMAPPIMIQILGIFYTRKSRGVLNGGIK